MPLPDIAPDGPLGKEKGTSPLSSQISATSIHPSVQPLFPLIPHNSYHAGLLSVLGDPLGQVLDKGLKPIGVVTGSIANPSGEALLNVQKQAKKEVGYSDEEKPEEEWPGGKRIGGNKQTGENPLGL